MDTRTAGQIKQYLHSNTVDNYCRASQREEYPVELRFHVDTHTAEQNKTVFTH